MCLVKRIIINTWLDVRVMESCLDLSRAMLFLPLFCVAVSTAMITGFVSKLPFANDLSWDRVALVFLSGVLLGLVIVQIGLQIFSKPIELGSEELGSLDKAMIIDWRYVQPLSLLAGVISGAMAGLQLIVALF